MYYDHFGLNQAPFKITPNTDFFFTGANRGPVLEALIYAITHGEGIVKVTGEVGSGKTMLCNMLQNRLPENVESVYLANPSVGPEEVLHAIAFELQLGIERKAEHLEVMHALQDYLVTRHADGKRVVAFIEESQSMPLATLEEIRLLSNLETRNDKLLQIVLFGQPELDENLRRPNIRQLRDRIAHSFKLEPLTEGEVREYLTFRMRAAGYRGPEIFNPAVGRQITKASSGLTRRINLIADKTLLAAFSENTHTIESKHVQAALRDSEFSPPLGARRIAHSPALALAGVALVIGAGLGAALYALLGTRAERPVSEAPVAAPIAAPVAAPVAVIPASEPAGPAAPDASAQAAKPVAAQAARPEVAPPAPASTRPAASSAPAPASAEPVRRTDSAPGTTARPAPPPVAAQKAPSPAVSPPTRAEAVAATGDVIAERMEATRSWLKSGVDNAYSIQLLASGDVEHLRIHLRSLPKSIEMTDIYMYRTVAQEKAMVNVLYGSFPTWANAQAALAELPASLRANRPYVRALSSVRAEADRQSESRRR